MKIKSYLVKKYNVLSSTNLALRISYRWKYRQCRLTIMSPKETINKIITKNCSISRFGDGEMELVLDPEINLGFQKKDKHLSEKLTEVLKNENENLMICLPYTFISLAGRTNHSTSFWYDWCRRNNQYMRMFELIQQIKKSGYCFGDSQITRPYIAYKTRKHAKKIFPLLKQIWNDKNILFVEGEQTRLGVGNDLFDNARSIKRILCPAINAFDSYDEIIESIIKYWNDEIVLLALGPTATVMAADLADKGIQALDIGHIDIEYEWMLMGAKGHDKVGGKYTNEATENGHVSECSNADYLEQIICRVNC